MASLLLDPHPQPAEARGTTAQPTGCRAKAPARKPRARKPQLAGPAPWRSRGRETRVRRKARRTKASDQATFPDPCAPGPRSQRADHPQTARTSPWDRSVARGSALSSPRLCSRPSNRRRPPPATGRRGTPIPAGRKPRQFDSSFGEPRFDLAGYRIAGEFVAIPRVRLSARHTIRRCGQDWS